MKSHMRIVVMGTILLPIMVCLSCLAGICNSSSGGDVLYLRTTQDNGGPFFHDIYDLGPSLDNDGNGQAKTSSFFGNHYFMTPPLATGFFLPNATLTVYHERNPYSESNFTAILYRYNATQQEEPTEPGVMNSVVMAVNSTVDSITFNLDLPFLQGERILLWVLGVWSGGNRLDWYWGNNTYPSRISYPGTAIYVPEFRAEILIPMLIAGTLLAVIVHTRRARVDPRAPKRLSRF